MPYEKNPKHDRKLYGEWERGGYFKADPESGRPPFALMIPPPNVTGSLHIGHAFTMTRQDISARYHRMKGKDVLWLPGTDHASIAVQMLVERQLAGEGLSRREIGREKFLARAWEWKELYAGSITEQLRRLGCSLDWSREAFTMDAGFSRAVEHAFIRMYEDGLIYRDTRLVNWDPSLLTTVSDLEVDMAEEQGSMWHVRYMVEGGDAFITVATTRPETMLGDAAVAVNPGDGRYKGLVGKFVILPLVGRRIPIIADEYADMDKGTGAVKITPAHDFNDYEVGKRHGLREISVLEPDGTIARIPDGNDFTGILAGRDRFEAREMIVEKLKETGALEKVEPCLHAVPRSQRGGAILEPRLTTQWYCDVKALAARAIEKVKSGEMGFIPKLWENTFFSWLENIQPWCISRQLWWGHQIPAYYGKDGKLAYVGKNPPTGLARDEDVLDTWFSSGLWPMATLGWPDESAPDFKKYFPNSVLVTGFDIIFFWVARMAMFSLYFTGKAPFGKVVLHGLVTDERGVKMSKTKGNVINPLDFIGEFGADPLRFAICLAANQNRTNPFGKANVENAKKFLTKLLNAVAFWEINGIAGAPEKFDAARSAPAADWIIGRMNGAVAAAEAGMEAYRYDEYANNIYHFVWDDFCSAFIEAAKPELAGANRGAILSAAHEALKGMLKMLQPVTPFIAAELWERLGFGKEVDLIREPFAAQITLGKANIANAEKFQLELETKLSAANRDEEIAKSRAELAATEKRIGSLSKQLSNKGFTENAKPDVLAEYRNALAEAEAKKKLLEEKIG